MHSGSTCATRLVTDLGRGGSFMAPPIQNSPISQNPFHRPPLPFMDPLAKDGSPPPTQGWHSPKDTKDSTPGPVDRETPLKTLHSRNFAGGNKLLFCVN